MSLIRYYIITSMLAFFSALLFYAIYNNWIILRMPWQVDNIVNNVLIIQKKEITFHYFHGDKWKTEKQDLLWSDSIEKNIFHIINAYLVLIDEEHITTKKISLQSVLVTPSYTAYVSFDRNILHKEETIFKKWMLIEGILKTINRNNIPITHIQFLVQHQLLQDTHLDFSLPWPIHGFII